MSKRTKTLILALLALVLLVGAFFAVKLLLPEEEVVESSSASTPITLISMEADEIASIEVDRPEGGFTLRNKNGVASIDGLSGLPLDADLMQETISTITTLFAKEVVAENPDNYGVYGLDNPSYTAKVTRTDGTSFTLEFGLESSASYGTYTKLKGSPEVYIIYNSNLTGLRRKTEDFISAEIAATVSEGADFFSIKYSGANYPEPLLIEKHNADEDDDATYSYFTYFTVEPKWRPVDTEIVFTYVDEITQATATDILAGNYTQETLASYGLDEPDTIVEVTFTEQFEEDAVYKYSLSFQDGKVYAICNDVPIIYTLEDADWMHLTYEKALHSLFLLPSIYDIGSVDIDLNGKQYTFEVSGEKSENVVIDGKTIDALAFSKFYQILIGANHDGNYVTDIVPETEALLSITFHYRDGQESDTIRFFEAGPRKNYAEVNGEIEFTMMASFVEAVEEALDVVLAGEVPDPDWKS